MPVAIAVSNGKKTSHHDGGRREARSSLFAPPTVRTLREGLPADRFSFLSSAGHRQKRWIRSEAGWTRFRAISHGLYN